MKILLPVAFSLMFASAAFAADATPAPAATAAPAAAAATAAPAAAAEKSSKCKATNLDGSELVAEITTTGATTTKALIACTTQVKDKVKELKCTPENGGTKIEYTLTSEFAAGKWTKGTKSTATCPKVKAAAPAKTDAAPMKADAAPAKP